MQRFTPLRDVTPQTVGAHLLPLEELLESGQHIGLYDGKEKDAERDAGQLTLTTHRLLYVDYTLPYRNSCALELSLIRQTEYWAGFLKSSPKITLTLGDPPSLDTPSASSRPSTPSTLANTTVGDGTSQPARSWICRVCGFSNVHPSKCTLCGVNRAEYVKPIDSRPQSRASTPRPPATHAEQNEADAKDNRIACGVCTYLNHPALSACEMCGSALSTYSAQPPSSEPPTLKPLSTKVTDDAPSHVRLSFRKGGVQTFYAALKRALLAKAWESSSEANSNVNRTTGGGIDGILRNIQIDAQSKSDEMSDALADLQSLMAKAKSMIDLAQSMSTKLPKVENNSDQGSDQATAVVATSLLSLGLPTPAVTQDMVKSQREYWQLLAKELASVLTSTSHGRPSDKQTFLNTDLPPSESNRGIVPLDEIWCIWNRARGVSLVSPRDLNNACEYLPQYAPLSVRRFKSGLVVLHTDHYKPLTYERRLLDWMQGDLTKGASALDVARAEYLSVSLAQEMMEEIEQSTGGLVRDSKGPNGISWFPNIIAEFVFVDVNS